MFLSLFVHKTNSNENYRWTWYKSHASYTSNQPHHMHVRGSSWVSKGSRSNPDSSLQTRPKPVCMPREKDHAFQIERFGHGSNQANTHWALLIVRRLSSSPVFTLNTETSKKLRKAFLVSLYLCLVAIQLRLNSFFFDWTRAQFFVIIRFYHLYVEVLTNLCQHFIFITSLTSFLST